MTTILREIGTIARALDSIANVEFKQHQLAASTFTSSRLRNAPASLRINFPNSLRLIGQRFLERLVNWPLKG